MGLRHRDWRTPPASYAVRWDNNRGASGVFYERFAREEDAERRGQAWADECNLRDLGATTPEAGEGYAYDVIETDDPPTVHVESEDPAEVAWDERAIRSWRL